ncbi:MAG: autotransporter assembly complex protein TamA [Succinivibrio sp.]|nr:autotransporter assembly complex protein TamA [Succinivibrio sp.]
MSKIVKNSFFQTLLLVVLQLLLGGVLIACSSDEEKLNTQRVTDALSIKVFGDLAPELRENLESTFAAMPSISRKRASVFVREIREQATKALHALGYYHPQLEIHVPREGGDFKDIIVIVDPGKPLFIRECQIDITGEGAFYHSFLKLIAQSKLKSYAILDHGAYEDLKAQLQSNALALGFFDAKLITHRLLVYEEENVCDVELLFDTGKRYQYGELKISERSQELFKPASSLYNLQEGKPFSTDEINSFSSSMVATGYYKTVDVRPKVEERHDYKVPVGVELERQPHNLVRTGIGFSTDERARLLLAWDKPLLNEWGHSLTSYARLSMVKQNAQLIYKIPRDNPNTDYYYIKLAQTHTKLNDTTSDQSHVSFHYVANKTGKWQRDYYLAYEYEDYKQGYETGYANNLMPGLTLTRRETSGGFDPHYGYSVSLDVKGASKLVTDLNFLRMNLVWKMLFSPTANTRLFFRFQQGLTFGSDSRKVPPSMRFFAGGDQTVRGYKYLSEAPRNDGGLIGARYMTTGTAEYQFPCGIQDSRLAVFFDGGIVCNEYDGTEDPIGSPGIGYRYISKYGAVRVDLAYGLYHDSGFRLHFSFGPEF